jgi:hypothetical protein
MAEAPNEEPVDKESDAPEARTPEESVVPSEQEIKQIADLESESANPIPPTDTMEVHHHAHIHSKSKWKEYVFQFFMLFLAVFCGFLAEYQLEHKIEGDREKTYMQSMIEDLEKDTLNLSFVINAFDQINLHLDTVIHFYPVLSEGYTDVFYRNFRFLRGYPDFIYSDRTMLQLKNSGAMRLIRNEKVVGGIVSYDSNIRDLVYVDIPSLDSDFTTSINLRRQLLDYAKLEHDLDSKSISQLEDEKNIYLLKNDKALLGELNNVIRDLQEAYALIIEKDIALKHEAKGLIALIKKEYNLE